jgi:hypothetical protein
VERFIWRLPVLRACSQFQRGALEGVFASLCGLTIAWLVLPWIDSKPSATALEGLAQISATLLVAFAVLASQIIDSAGGRPSLEADLRLGAFAVISADAVIAIGVSLALADQVAGKHWTFLDELGYAWVVSAVLLVGIFVALQPIVTDSWRAPGHREASDDD